MDRRRHAWIAAGLALAAVSGVVAARVLGEKAEPDVDAEVVRAAPAPTTTTTTDPSTLRGFPAYRATIAVPMIAVRDSADAAAPVIVELPQLRESGLPQTFLIEEETRDPAGTAWYRVLLPVAPNGSTGWVPASDVLVEGLTHRVRVYLSAFRLELYEGDRLVRTYPIGVGTADTPTPGGEYYVNEAFELTRSNSAYGSHALALSGFSEVLSYWRGGGVLGIHGTNKPESIGTYASHGCIRMRNEDIAELFPLVPQGTPVEIVA